MALLEFAATAAGAGIIAIDVRESPIENSHHLFRFAVAPNQPGQ